MKQKFIMLMTCCLGIMLVGVPAVQAAPLAHWSFDEGSGTVAHDSINSYNGNLSATGAAFVSGGVSGGAMSLNKSQGGLVNMGNVLNLAGTDYTISAWVKTSTTADNAFPVAKHQSTVVAGYILGINTSGVVYGAPNKAWFYNAYGADTPVSATIVNDNNWHQLVGVRDADGDVSLYVDGVFQVAKTAQVLPDVSADLLFGGLWYGTTPTSSYDGLLDDVQFYNTALTSGDVQYLYQNPGKVIPTPLPGAVWLLGAGLAGLIGVRRKK